MILNWIQSRFPYGFGFLSLCHWRSSLSWQENKSCFCDSFLPFVFFFFLFLTLQFLLTLPKGLFLWHRFLNECDIILVSFFSLFLKQIESQTFYRPQTQCQQEEQSLLSISTIEWWESKYEFDVWQKESKQTHACHWCIHSTAFKWWKIIKRSQFRSNTDNGLFVMCQWHWQMPGTCFMIHTQQNESIFVFVFVWFWPVLQKSTFRHLTETDHCFLIITALKQVSCSGSQHSLRSFPLFRQHLSSPRTSEEGNKHPIARASFPFTNAWSQHP